MKVLMVCLGNICRSPLAEGIMQNLIDRQHLPWKVDSAGTSGYHAGSPPDIRSIEIAQKYGISIESQRSRKFHYTDFEQFDKILAMDSENYSNIIQMAENDAERAKVELIMNYAYPAENRQVPDPYYDRIDGFDKVFNMLQIAAEKFVDKHKKQ